MKKLYLLIVCTVMGLGGLYAMLNRTLGPQNTSSINAAKATLASPKAPAPKNKIKSTVNCCPVEDSLILGTWIAVGDPLSKWVFGKDKICYEYYADTLVDRDQYRMLSASDSPLCGIDVSKGTLVNYMEWTNLNNPDDKMCFVVYSLTDEVLNVTLFGTGDFLIFRRPWSDFEP